MTTQGTGMEDKKGGLAAMMRGQVLSDDDERVSA